MKTRLLIITGVAIIIIFFLIATLGSSLLSDISYTLFHYLPERIKNNPLTHHFVISDIHNTREYEAFVSQFTIYDEGIIHVGSGMEYKVVGKNNHTGNLLVLNFKYHPHSDKLRSDIRCSVIDAEGIAHVYPSGKSHDTKVSEFIESTDCLENEGVVIQNKQLASIQLHTNKDTYHTNEKVMVFGSVDKITHYSKITIVISNPLENIVAIKQTNVSEEGTFSVPFQIGGTLWEQNGQYTVTAKYGGAILSKVTFVYLSDLDAGRLL